MTSSPMRRDLLPFLRECKEFDKRRQRPGLTPAEHERWLELKDLLGASLTPSERERRRFHRVPVRINVSFETPRALREATISNLSHGGVFVSTSHPPDIGTKLTLSLRVASTGARVELPCVVVSQNVGADLSTRTLGMGLRFCELNGAEREAVDQLYEEAIAKTG